MATQLPGLPPLPPTLPAQATVSAAPGSAGQVDALVATGNARRTGAADDAARPARLDAGASGFAGMGESAPAASAEAANSAQPGSAAVPTAPAPAHPAAGTAATATPPSTATQHAQPATQVAQALVTLGTSSADGGKTLEVQLTPDDLGKVQIRVVAAADGSNAVQVTAEHQATLGLLRADAGTLVQALGRAGIAVSQGSLDFRLAGDAGAATPGSPASPEAAAAAQQAQAGGHLPGHGQGAASSLQSAQAPAQAGTASPLQTGLGQQGSGFTSQNSGGEPGSQRRFMHVSLALPDDPLAAPASALPARAALRAGLNITA